MDTEAVEDEVCEHAWKYIRDYEGDPGVYHGIHDLSYWECIHCGEQVSKQPNED